MERFPPQGGWDSGPPASSATSVAAVSNRQAQHQKPEARSQKPKARSQKRRISIPPSTTLLLLRGLCASAVISNGPRDSSRLSFIHSFISSSSKPEIQNLSRQSAASTDPRSSRRPRLRHRGNFRLLEHPIHPLLPDQTQAPPRRRPPRHHRLSQRPRPRTQRRPRHPKPSAQRPFLPHQKRKGGRHRVVPLPKALEPTLNRQLATAHAKHLQDLPVGAASPNAPPATRCGTHSPPTC